ncbi:SRPBCC family protein [Jatrophihabitans sp. DSM 45814]
MKVAGEALLHAPIEQVWAALNDPDVLVRTIPGCERLEPTGPDAYRMTLTAGVASIKGTYAGRVELRDQRQPSSFVLRASGAGAPGTVSADVQVDLSEFEGNTRLRYDADAVVGGVIGGVGQRMLTGVAKKMAGEFFARVDDELTSTADVESAPVPVRMVDSAARKVARSRTQTSFPDRGFLAGALIGAAIALAGVLVGSRRRSW